jgi:hypothetical protein
VQITSLIVICSGFLEIICWLGPDPGPRIRRCHGSGRMKIQSHGTHIWRNIDLSIEMLTREFSHYDIFVWAVRKTPLSINENKENSLLALCAVNYGSLDSWVRIRIRLCGGVRIRMQAVLLVRYWQI